MSGAAPIKAPVNRKVAIYIVAMIGGLVLLAVLIAVTKDNPQQQREEAKKEAELAAVKALPAGTEQSGKEAITRHAGSFDASKLFDSPLDGGESKASNGPSTTKQGAAGLPPVDPTTLSQLDQAFQAASKPDTGVSSSGSIGGIGSSIAGTAGGAAGHDAPAGTYEAYPKQSDSLATTAAQATGMESSNASSKAAPGTYPVIKPQTAPDGMIITKGTLIRMVLDTKIDTRNAGDVTATVTQDVYDSLRQSEPLVRKGSHMLGTYGTKVSPGLPSIPVTFSRLELTDGRIVDMGKAVAVNYEGATGIDGTYHSNILRALGPSLVVALIGTAVNNMSKTNTSATNSAGTTVQSPTVAEQIAPQVNSEVLSRYSAATPYFIVKAGTQFKIEMQSDVVIPGGATPRYPAYGETNADAQQQEQAASSQSDASASGVWEAGASAQ